MAPQKTRGTTRDAGTTRELDVDALLADRGIRILVCCGAGGVGKTTTAAAIALRAAESGRSGGGADHRPGPAARAVARA
jgi:Mrp family chromosome partitioning ATPase